MLFVASIKKKLFPDNTVLQEYSKVLPILSLLKAAQENMLIQ